MPQGSGPQDTGNSRHFSASLQKPLLAWLAMTQRRQLRRVRMWDPRPDEVRHLCVVKGAVHTVDKGQDGGSSDRCLRPR